MQVMMTTSKQSQDGTPGYDNRFQAETGLNSILTLLGNGHHKLHETYQCRIYNKRLLMMGKEVARNM
jgi:hypothetical protein